MLRVRAAVVAAASVALVASVASPADADRARFEDNRRFKGGMDVHSVHVKNKGRFVTVRSRHRNLRYHKRPTIGGIQVFLDVARRRKGPEVAISAGVGFDSDYRIGQVHRWNVSGDDYFCLSKLRINYRRDVITVRISRGCLDRVIRHRTGKVRVAVRASRNRGYGLPSRSDWAPRPRHLFRAVRHS